MPSTLPILRERRERRIARQQTRSARRRGAILSAGMILSVIFAALIIFTALAYADLTRDLPSIEILPRLFNPPDGLLLQPTRVYDRTGGQLLKTFSINESPRRYFSLDERAARHLPKSLADAIVVESDPQFWSHAGYAINGLDNPDFHGTIAQKLVADFLLFNEPPSLRRALRERILAAQITARFGHTQVLEWYLNSAAFGHYAYGADAAAQLYFNKSAGDLTLAESAVLAAVSDTPSLNPLDAPQAALQRGRELIHVMNALGFANAADTADALAETPKIQSAPPAKPEIAPAFMNLILAQLDSQFPRQRVERGGFTVIATLDYDLQKQTTCATEVFARRLMGANDSSSNCEAARLLPPLPPNFNLPDSSVSALITDPKTGQILALVGETQQGQSSSLVTAHKPGTSLDPFVYLTGFTRGLSPASLMWDIPTEGIIQKNFDNDYHGPVRLRTALVNDYQIPVGVVEKQMGMENVNKTAASFGIDMSADATMLELANAYDAFAAQGVQFGRRLDDEIKPYAILRVESNDHSVWLDWSQPDVQPVVTPALAYLMTNVLSDESARTPTLGRPNFTEIGRPAGLKLGRTEDGFDAWAIGYTPARTVVVWTGTHNTSIKSRLPAALWSALMQYASRGLPTNGWSVPPDVTTMMVCDPSGLLPTNECPNDVSEVFLNGNEPIQSDNLYRAFDVNRETGLLATVFTPSNLVEKRVYLVVPDNARAWAQSAGLSVPPASYDAIQIPRMNPDVNIVLPALFSEVSGKVEITGTASGADFVSYRVLVGKGLNPQDWIQIGSGNAAVNSNVLGEWDTKGLSGLYAIQLQVVRSDQRVDTAITQVTVK